jgi:hypothetical protein
MELDKAKKQPSRYERQEAKMNQKRIAQLYKNL